MRKNTVPQTVTQDELFWSRVDDSGDCWLWVGSRDRQGYGKVGRKGRGPMFAHRYAWELSNGPIPDGSVIRHSCDNPPCVNPVHLQVGTQKDNIADRQRRGRHRPGRLAGEQHSQAKLTQVQVDQIRLLYAAGANRAVLARQYGVTYKTIWVICNGRGWKQAA